jgi:carboxypeptidase Taq
MLKEIPNAADSIASLELQPIFDWLQSNMWDKASLLGTQDLLKSATGESLNASHFLNHIRNRYL